MRNQIRGLLNFSQFSDENILRNLEEAKIGLINQFLYFIGIGCLE